MTLVSYLSGYDHVDRDFYSAGTHRMHTHKPEPQEKSMHAPITQGPQPLACGPGSSLLGSALCMLLEVHICVSLKGLLFALLTDF